MKYKHSLKNIILILSAIITAVAFSLVYYNSSLNKRLTESTFTTLEEVMEQQKYSLYSMIKTEVNVITTASDILTNHKNAATDRDSVVSLLKAVMRNSDFDRILVSNINGEALTDTNALMNIHDREYFKRSINGETVVSDIYMSEITGLPSIVISAPLISGGANVGIIASAKDIRAFNDFFMSSFHGSGYAFVCDNAGNIIAKTNNENAITEGDNLLVSYENVKFKNGDSFDTLDDILQKIKNMQSGRAIYTYGGHLRLMQYSPVGINDWYIFSVVPDLIISQKTKDLTKSAMSLTFAIFFVFLALIFYITYTQKKYASSLYKIAYYDEMTGVSNLPKFKYDASVLLKKHGINFFIIKLDIANFKMVNEMYGIEAGDEVIQNITAIMSDMSKKPNCMFCRVHGDEFLVLDTYKDLDEIEESRTLFEKVFRELDIKARQHRIEFRYGRYIIEKGETDIDAILEKVNLAHRIARINKSDKITDYDNAVKEDLVKEAELESMMFSALKNGEFKVYLQPKYSLDNESMTGAEALVRWYTHDGRVISPGDFIPLFEKNGFITKLDVYIFRKVCEILSKWIADGLEPIVVSVNFSRLHLDDESFVDEIWAIADSFKIPKKYLEIELTESTMFNNEDALERVLKKLHTAGFTLSMDDFGTGYSSLGLLKNLPVDVIKIDRSFFTDSKFKTRTKAVLGNVMRMAKELGIQTVAEGVETTEHVNLLRDLKCDMVQGYYYAKPMPADELDIEASPPVPDPNDKELEFSVGSLGEIKDGRITLGEEMPMSVYRLFQFTMREVLSDKYGEGEMIDVFRSCGKLAGKAFAREHLDLSLAFDEFSKVLHEKLRDYKIGLLNIDSFDEATGKATLTVKEDLDCSGVESRGKTLCNYDEGFIEGILEEYTQRSYTVVEVACWGTGADACRFEVWPK